MKPVAVLLGFTPLWIGCDGGSGDAGTLRVLIDPEDVIIDGLDPGDSGARVRDGWRVQFDKYLVTVGNVEVRWATDERIDAVAPQLHVVDLTQVPTHGLELWQLEGLRPGRWEFNFETGGAAHGARRHESVRRDDFDQMVDGDWTYLIEGAITKDDGRSCPPAELATPPLAAEVVGESPTGDPCYAAEQVRFELGVRAETYFGPCAIDGVPGVSIPTGGEQTVSITIHGDHLFFNGFPAGSESGIRRLAQWWADADLNLDGVVTGEELEEISPAAILSDEYALGGTPITPLDDMSTYVAAQLKTQGHYQGEGECLIDGRGHDHAHDDDAHDDDAHDDDAHDDDAHDDDAHDDDAHDDDAHDDDAHDDDAHDDDAHDDDAHDAGGHADGGAER